MLSEAKHLAAARDRPFAEFTLSEAHGLRVTVQMVKDSSSQLNFALVSNTTHDKRRLCPRQVSQRFVMRTFCRIGHLTLTFSGFNAIVDDGSLNEQVPSRTFREHSHLLTNRVKFYGPG